MDERLEDLHCSLITSEQKRIQLSQELQQLMSCSNKSDRLRDIQLKSQMERFKSHRQKSLERNQMIRRQMQQFELNMSGVAAKTQALRALKVEYEEYIERLYPRWKEQVLAKAAQERDKQQRLAAMTRDIRLDEELSPPANNHRQSHHSHSATSTSHDLSHDECRCTCLSCTNNETSQSFTSSSSLSTQLSHLFEPSHSSSCAHTSSFSHLILRPLKIVSCLRVISPPHLTAHPHNYQRSLRGFKKAFDGVKSLFEDGGGMDLQSVSSYSKQANGSLSGVGVGAEELPAPQRSSTPDYGRLSEPRAPRGYMSASQQSVVSEKSVTFADTSLKPPNDFRLEEQRAVDLRYSSRDSPRRLTPSPSELIRTSMEFGDSSSIATVASSQSFANPLAASLPPPHRSTSPRRHDQSTRVEVHQPPTVLQSTGYASPPSPAPSQPVASSAPTTSHTPIVHSVVVPSAEVAGDVDSPAADAVDGGDSAGTGVPSVDTPAPSKSLAVHKHADAVAEMGVSMSSLNTTTEEPPAVDLAQTNEFRSMLGNETATRGNYESDDSEDSMVAAIENEYSRQLALKTNTLPMQRPITLPSEGPHGTPTPEGPSDDEDDSLTGVMGYTPSFAKSGQTDSTRGGEERPAKDTDTLAPPTSTINSTGSNNSRRKPAFLRTNSDVESLSDLPMTSNQVGATSAASKSAEENLDDDFDFYG